MKNSRREFIKSVSATAAGTLLSSQVFSQAMKPEVIAHPMCVFTKCLQFLDYDQVGETLAQAGFDGADLSVRPGGHVLPENVTVDLPRAVKALKKSGISVPMMVSGINNADDPLTEKVLGTASELGIRYYRMAYLTYDQTLSVPENLDLQRKTFEKLEKVNRKFSIHGEYQNHSGIRIGGPVWDLYWLLKDRDPSCIGVQYDIHHAVCEGAFSWPVGLKLLAPWIKTIPIKDFVWKIENGKWKTTDVPLGEGMVDFDAFLKEYKRFGLSGPVTLHFEYDLGGAESGKLNPKKSREEILVYLKKDLSWIRNKFKEHDL